jgi:hypothetical protein
LTRKRWSVVGIVAAIIALYLVFLRQFPNEAECVASGRVVDPTRRHCESASGYVQLREHVLFHSPEALVYLVIAGMVAFFLLRWRARRSRSAAATAGHQDSPGSAGE